MMRHTILSAKDGLPIGKFAIGHDIAKSGISLEEIHILTQSQPGGPDKAVLFDSEDKARGNARSYLRWIAEMHLEGAVNTSLCILHRTADGQLVKISM